jgi:DNA-binding NtrC family response regulator
VGKELVARAIQGESERAGKPFVTVNCGAIPENLVESILFGHERGAFTGAKDRHTGKFQEANGGTLFLDEIGELPLDMQVKLLRALQEGEIDPVGARKPVRVDIRLISATNRNLTQLVEEGRFREDLFYRLNVFPIHIPPLRERVEEIPELVHHFVARFAAEEGKKVTGVEQSAMEMLKRFPWPGNVRQLENAIFRAVVLTDHALLTVDDFPQLAHFAQRLSPDAPQPEAQAAQSVQTPVAGAAPAPAAGASERGWIPAPPAPVEPVSPALPRAKDHGVGISATQTDGHLRTLQDIESEVIRLALEHYHGHMSEVARRLGIGRSTLYRKVRELGLDKSAASG